VSRFGGKAYVAGTFDTKGAELHYIARMVRDAGIETVTVDLGTLGIGDGCDVGPAEVAAHHPEGAGAVLGLGDRGAAVSAMAVAFARFIDTRTDVGGMIGAGGTGGTTLIAPAMRRLAVGIPKVLVSTVASGDVRNYVGPADITMVHAVVDVQGLNSISRRVLGNAANALAGMMSLPLPGSETPARPAIGITMFGVTTPCVQMVTADLQATHDCLVFHATGTGGRAMEKLVDSGLISAVLDLTTTEICDMLVGGVFAADADRFGAVIRTGVPYVGSLGALDMVNFGPMETVPAQFADRRLYVHNPQVTLMRTSVAENLASAEWIAARLNQMQGPVRFLVPEGGVSLIDMPGMPFHDPAADQALFDRLEALFVPSDRRRLIRVPHAINHPAFAQAAVTAFKEICP
jgi:uncharacterized protein (UPF0261 family)